MAEKSPWWKNGIIYQIYPRSFSDSNHDGIGDIPGIISRLDYVSDLGVDAIWLSPVYSSPHVDFGYDVSNYMDIDPIFGTLKDYDRLLREAHKRNIRVIMDLVMNHTSDEHPWFIQSRSSRDNPHRDWYLWRNPGINGKPPNNWYSIFGGRAWEYDSATKQYYLHIFHKKQPDLNWRNPEVIKAMLAVVKFWLDHGTDGFRLDVFNSFYKHPEMPDNPHKCWGWRGYERQHHIYDCDQPEMIPLLSEFRKLLDGYPGRYMVGETFLSTPAKAALYSGKGLLHSAFNFTMLECHWDPQMYLRAITQWMEAAGKEVWPNNVLNNHDNPRSVTRWHDDPRDCHARLAATMLLTLRGTPFVYYGEEIGIRDITLRPSQIMDPPGKRYWPFYKGRDGCRSPMQWDDSPQAGFSTIQPWLPLNRDFKERNVAAQLKDPASLLNVYKRLIVLRRQEIALQQGDFSIIKQNNPWCITYQRAKDGEYLLVVLNFSIRQQKIRLKLPENKIWHAIFSTHRIPPSDSLETIKLEPYQAIIFKADKSN